MELKGRPQSKSWPGCHLLTVLMACPEPGLDSSRCPVSLTLHLAQEAPFPTSTVTVGVGAAHLQGRGAV